MTSLSPTAKEEHHAGFGVTQAHQEHPQNNGNVEGPRLDRDLDAELAHLLEQINAPPVKTAPASGGDSTIPLNENSKQIQQPSSHRESTTSHSRSSSRNRGIPKGREEDAVPTSSGRSPHDVEVRVTPRKVPAKTAACSSSIKAGRISRSRQDSRPSSSASPTAIARVRAAADERPKERNGKSTGEQRQSQVNAAAAKHRKRAQGITAKNRASLGAAKKHCDNKQSLGDPPFSQGTSIRGSGKLASTTSSAPATLAPLQRPVTFKATRHTARLGRKQPAGGLFRVAPAAEGTGGRVSAVPSSAVAAHPALAAIRGALGAVAASVLSAATASNRPADVAVPVLSTRRATADAELALAKGGFSERIEVVDLQHSEQSQASSDATTANGQLTGTAGTRRKPVMAKKVSPRTASFPSRTAKLGSRKKWKRARTDAGASRLRNLHTPSSGNLAFTGRMRPRPRPRNGSHDLCNSFAEMPDSPYHPLYGSTCRSGEFGDSGVAKDRSIMRAGLNSSKGVSSALPYRTRYERPGDHLVGMQNDTHYQLRKLSKHLSARQPELRRSRVAAAKKVKQQGQRQPRTHSRHRARPRSTNIKFRLRLLFAPGASLPALEIEGAFVRTSDGRYSLFVKSAKRILDSTTTHPSSVESKPNNASSATDANQVGGDDQGRSGRYSAAGPAPAAARAARCQCRGKGIRKNITEGEATDESAEAKTFSSSQKLDCMRPPDNRSAHCPRIGWPTVLSRISEGKFPWKRAIQLSGHVEGTVTLAWDSADAREGPAQQN